MTRNADLATQFGQAFRFRTETAPIRQVGGIAVRRLSVQSVDTARWDAFTAESSASFQVGLGHIRSQALKSASSLNLFEFHDAASGEKIGQCAVLRRGRDFTIQDGIQLTPGRDAMWQQALTSLLRRLGYGRYSYGGLWSSEVAREAGLLAMPGVRVESVRSFTVQGVDFSQWDSWDNYWKSVSENVRRNARYAQERVPGLRIEQYRGWSMLKTIGAIVRLQQHSLTKKGLDFNGFKQAARFAYQMAFNRKSLDVAFAVGDEGILASFYGARIGGKYYYVHGGQKAGGSGASWFLMREMARQAYERDPNGQFVMGNVDYAIHDEEVGGGLLRARRSMRVTNFETSIVDFTYTRSR